MLTVSLCWSKMFGLTKRQGRSVVATCFSQLVWKSFIKILLNLTQYLKTKWETALNCWLPFGVLVANLCGKAHAVQTDELCVTSTSRRWCCSGPAEKALPWDAKVPEESSCTYCAAGLRVHGWVGISTAPQETPVIQRFVSICQGIDKLKGCSVQLLSHSRKDFVLLRAESKLTPIHCPSIHLGVPWESLITCSSFTEKEQLHFLMVTLVSLS